MLFDYWLLDIEICLVIVSWLLVISIRGGKQCLAEEREKERR